MAKIKIRPLDDRVVVEPVAAEEKTAGGIVLPDSAKEKPQRGKVVAVGPGKLLDNGQRATLSVVVGDEVIYGKYGGTDIEVNGDDVKIDDEGRFRISYDAPPPGPIVLAATDAAGHQTKVEVFAPVERPMTRGVHMTAISWAEDDLREQVFDMLDAGIINTVELDIKDEGGVVGWDTENALAHEVGAVEEHYDLEAAVAELHERGAYVVGRVVAFRERVALAHEHVDGFGIASVCGYGRVSPEELGVALHAHRECAEALRA